VDPKALQTLITRPFPSTHVQLFRSPHDTHTRSVTFIQFDIHVAFFRFAKRTMITTRDLNLNRRRTTILEIVGLRLSRHSTRTLPRTSRRTPSKPVRPGTPFRFPRDPSAARGWWSVAASPSVTRPPTRRTVPFSRVSPRRISVASRSVSAISTRRRRRDARSSCSERLSRAPSQRPPKLPTPKTSPVDVSSWHASDFARADETTDWRGSHERPFPLTRNRTYRVYSLALLFLFSFFFPPRLARTDHVISRRPWTWMWIPCRSFALSHLLLSRQRL